MNEQEALLNGYQQENERLYQDLKKREADKKKMESKMFTENQKLGTYVLFPEKICISRADDGEKLCWIKWKIHFLLILAKFTVYIWRFW